MNTDIYNDVIEGSAAEEIDPAQIDLSQIDAQELRSLLECDQLIRQTVHEHECTFVQELEERIALEAEGPEFAASLLVRIQRRIRRRNTVVALAAALLIAVLLQFLLRPAMVEPLADYSYVHAFADGGRIDYREGSVVHWQEDQFGQEVILRRGELHASIAKQNDRRYIFTTEEGRVLVRGTSFTLNQDKEQSVIDLRTGSVDVESAGTQLGMQAPSRALFMKHAAPQLLPVKKQNLFIITDFMSYDDYLAVIEVLYHPGFKLCGIIATAGNVEYNRDVHAVAEEINATLRQFNHADIPVLIGAQGIGLSDVQDIPAVSKLHKFAQKNDGNIAVANLGSYHVVMAALIQNYPATAQRCVLANLVRQRKAGWESVRDDGQEAFNYVRDRFPGAHYVLDEELAREWTRIRLSDLSALTSPIGKRIRERVSNTTETMPLWDQSLLAVLSDACIKEQAGSGSREAKLIMVEQLPKGDPEKRGQRTLNLVP